MMEKSNKRRIKMKWQNKLNKTQLQHVREYCGGTLTSFKICRLNQIEKNIVYGPRIEELCSECQYISIRLGLEIELQEKALEDQRAGKLDK